MYVHVNMYRTSLPCIHVHTTYNLHAQVHGGSMYSGYVLVLLMYFLQANVCLSVYECV